jgi:hypothetical protein
LVNIIFAGFPVPAIVFLFGASAVWLNTPLGQVLASMEIYGSCGAKLPNLVLVCDSFDSFGFVEQPPDSLAAPAKLVMVSVELPLRSHFPLRLGSSSSSGGTQQAPSVLWLWLEMAGTQVLWDFRAFLLAHSSEDLDEFCRIAIVKTEGNIGKLILFYPLLLFFSFCS